MEELSMRDLERRMTKMEECQQRTDDRYLTITENLVEIKVLLTTNIASDAENKKRIIKNSEKIENLEKSNVKIIAIFGTIVFLIETLPRVIEWFSK